MKLRPKILEKLNTPSVRVRLALALNCTEQTVIRYIKANDDNLTKAAALAVIREETGLEDSEVLEDFCKVS